MLLTTAARSAVRATSPKAPVVDLMTPAQAAVELQVTTRTLKRWRDRGCGPPFIRPGGEIRYSRRRLEAWAAETEATNNDEHRPHIMGGRR